MHKYCSTCRKSSLFGRVDSAVGERLKGLSVAVFAFTRDLRLGDGEKQLEEQDCNTESSIWVYERGVLLLGGDVRLSL